MTIIKAGYRVSVKTWENDADNYNNGLVEGLTKDEAKFVVDFIKLFSSQNDHRNRGIGNMYDPDKDERLSAEEKVKAVVDSHKDMLVASEALAAFIYEGEFNDDGWRDFAYNMTLAGGEFYTRVMDSYKVEFIPQDVELQDVTEEFK